MLNNSEIVVQLLAEALFIYLFSKASILALGPTQHTGELISCGYVARMWNSPFISVSGPRSRVIETTPPIPASFHDVHGNNFTVSVSKQRHTPEFSVLIRCRQVMLQCKDMQAALVSYIQNTIRRHSESRDKCKLCIGWQHCLLRRSRAVIWDCNILRCYGGSSWGTTWTGASRACWWSCTIDTAVTICRPVTCIINTYHTTPQLLTV